MIKKCLSNSQKSLAHLHSAHVYVRYMFCFPMLYIHENMYKYTVYSTTSDLVLGSTPRPLYPREIDVFLTAAHEISVNAMCFLGLGY